MAKTQVTIDGDDNVYEMKTSADIAKTKTGVPVYNLHVVRSNGRKIGFVPVRNVQTLQDVADWIADENSSFDESLLIQCLKAGVAINLQRLTRDAASGEKFTDADFDRIANRLDATELMKFAGRVNQMKEHCRKVWEKEQAEKDEEDDEQTVHLNVR